MTSTRTATLPGKAWVFAVLGCALVVAASGPARAAELSGSWRGPIEQGAPGGTATAEVRLTPDGEGFAARWTTVEGSAAEARFAPTGRPGVLAPVAGRLKSMLGSAAPNPLAGDELTWARRGDGSVFIYQLRIGNDGALALDRYAFEPQGDGLTLSAQRVGPEGKATDLMRAALKREGGK